MLSRAPLGVLIIDDSERDFHATRDLLLRSGGRRHDVTWAGSYAEGLAALVDGDCDVCLVDYDLDGQPGLDLVAEAQRSGARVPMILLNGHDMGLDDERCDTVADCLPKWQLTPALLDRSVHYAMERQAILTHARRLDDRWRVIANRLETLGLLVGCVAHDFNNMLTSIICEAEGMRGTLAHDDPGHSAALEIIGSSNRAASLTRQLLRFGSQGTSEPQLLDVNLLVEGIERMLRRLLGSRVGMVMELVSDPGVVVADAAALEQAIVNLVLNARDAMPDGGQVIVGTRNVCVQSVHDAGHCLAPGEYVVLSVTDEGTGMCGEVLSRIFEPFFTTKSPDRGTGLGLSSVRETVERTGGAVLVRSEPGVGSTFEAYVPRAR